MSDIYPPELKRYADIHGHICFGLAMGYRAGKCARQEFGSYPADSQEQVTVLLKSGDCTRDGILLVTPCTCQSWELLQGQSGKYVFIFYHRALSKAVRLAAKPKIMRIYEPIAELKEKIRRKSAAKDDVYRFWSLNKQAVKQILQMPEAALFDLQRFEMALLAKLNLQEGIYVPASELSPAKCHDVPLVGKIS